MKFTWKCPKCKEDDESEFKNIRQCQCGKCGFVSVFRESDFAFLSYMKGLEEKQRYEEAIRKVDIVKKNNLGE